METLFTKIAKGDIPCTKIYEDDVCFAILDINPVVKGHTLVIAKEPYSDTESCPDSVLDHLICVAKKIDIRQKEVLHTDGSNILINNHEASGQEIPHIHIHVIPRYLSDGRKLGFEHDSYKENEMSQFGDKLRF